MMYHHKSIVIITTLLWLVLMIGNVFSIDTTSPPSTTTTIPVRRRAYKIDQIESNHTLIRKELESRDWFERKKSNSYQFKWSWSWEMLKAKRDHQIVNHFPNFDEIGTKSGLTRNINNRLLSKETTSLVKQEITQFFPRSYDLSVKEERAQFIADFNRLEVSKQQQHINNNNQNNNNDNNDGQELVTEEDGAKQDNNNFKSISNDELFVHLNDYDSNHNNHHLDKHVNDNNNEKEVREEVEDDEEDEPIESRFDLQPWIDGNQNIWIIKPSSQARGVGIKLFNNLTEIFKYTERSGNQFIAQKYIESPYLVHGRKFDIRQFVLVKSLNPLVIFLYRDCYMRFCSIEYSTSNLQDRFIHLSNHQVQKDYLKDNHDEELDKLFPHNQWSLNRFKEYLNQQQQEEKEVERKEKEDVWDKEISSKIKRLVIDTLDTWPKQGQRNNSFELLGFDILLTKDMEPQLLEVNTNPGLHLLTEVVKVHHANAIRDMFKVILDCDTTIWNNGDTPAQIKHKLLNEKSAEELQKLFGDWELIHFGDYDATIPQFIHDTKEDEEKMKQLLEYIKQQKQQQSSPTTTDNNDDNNNNNGETSL